VRLTVADDEPFSPVHYFVNATQREYPDAFLVKCRRIIPSLALIMLGTYGSSTIGIVNGLAKRHAARR